MKGKSITVLQEMYLKDLHETRQEKYIFQTRCIMLWYSFPKPGVYYSSLTVAERRQSQRDEVEGFVLYYLTTHATLLAMLHS